MGIFIERFTCCCFFFFFLLFFFSEEFFLESCKPGWCWMFVVRENADYFFTGNTLTVNSDADEEVTSVVSHHSCSYYLSILKLVSIIA